MQTKIYPDSGDGAREALTDLSVHDAVADEAKATPDPQVDGVWLVEGDDYAAIVYLAGYRDPFGRVRGENDFEEVDEAPRSRDDLIDSGYGGGYDHPFDL